MLSIVQVQVFTSTDSSGFIAENAVSLSAVETIPILDPTLHNTTFFVDGYSLLTEIVPNESSLEVIQCVACSDDQTSFLTDDLPMGVHSCQCIDGYSRRRTQCVNPLQVASNLTSTEIPIGTSVLFNVTDEIKCMSPICHHELIVIKKVCVYLDE